MTENFAVEAILAANAGREEGSLTSPRSDVCIS